MSNASFYQMLCWILGAILLIVLILFISWMIWFFRQWRKLDEILEQFQKGNLYEVPVTDVQETRESRLVSEMRQILGRASAREDQAQSEKEQIMQLISDLFHQLKTPLANIILDVELLEKEQLDVQHRKKFLNHTKEQAAKMQWLMQSLLKASRLENGIISFRAKKVPVKETIAWAVGAVYAQASGKEIEILLEEFTDFSLYHNPKWTAEAISNVLENAVKYSPERSRITIRVQRLELYSSITIQDQGIGIAEQDFNKIFRRFYRGDNVRHEEGTGLGLYLAQLILQSERGYLTVSSRVGQGSSFSIFLLNECGDH